MTATVSLSATADILHAEFPLLAQEQLCVSFQVHPEDAPVGFPEHVGERVRRQQPSIGSFYAAYKNVALVDSISQLGLKLVVAYTKKKDTPKGPRCVVYFWFAPEDDARNFATQALPYAWNEFQRLVSNVYVTGESFTNDNGPACIVLKGVARCPAHTALALVEGELKPVDDEVVDPHGRT